MGFDTDTVSDKGLGGKHDADIGIAVQETNRMLFSLDLDFADVRRFPPGEHAGIVVFRPGSFGPLTVNQFIVDFVQRTDLAE